MKFALIAFGNEESYGLLFVGGELLRLKQSIRFFDAEAPGTADRVARWKPAFALFSPLTVFFPAARRLAGELKKRIPGLVTVFGGHHAMSDQSIASMRGIDTVVAGPVNGSIERLLAGERGLIRTNPTSPDALPLPARAEYYRDVPRMARRYRKIMISMLGCPWNCSYCSSSAGHLSGIFGPQAHKRYFLARRPIPALIEEAREIIRHPTQEIEWVDDDVFAGPDVEQWLPRFVQAWKKEIGLPLYVSSTSKLVLKASDSLLKSLKSIVNVVGLGVQAIRPSSLKLLNRSWDNETQMKSAYDRLRKFGYAVNLQCIAGLPVDDPVEDALETIMGLQRIGPGSVSSCYPLMIYPGAAMEAYCRKHRIPLNKECDGDTNSGMPGIGFSPVDTKRIRNICKLATMFVKYNVPEPWMRALTDIDLDDATSRSLSLARYRECVCDRLGDKGEEIFDDILKTMKLRY